MVYFTWVMLHRMGDGGCGCLNHPCHVEFFASSKIYCFFFKLLWSGMSFPQPIWHMHCQTIKKKAFFHWKLIHLTSNKRLQHRDGGCWREQGRGSIVWLTSLEWANYERTSKHLWTVGNKGWAYFGPKICNTSFFFIQSLHELFEAAVCLILTVWFQKLFF